MMRNTCNFGHGISSTQAGVTLARSTADFPDEVGERCVMTVTIPEAIAAGNATAAPQTAED